MVVKTRCFLAGLVAAMVGVPFSSMADIGPVMFQAESGTIGADFIIGDSSGVVYISNTNNNAGFTSTRPQIPSRVASYSVRFPSAGTYDLYGRVRVGPGGALDDSVFYGNGFGSKSVTAADDWIFVSGTDIRGFADPADVVTVGGSVGANVWKWMNLSQDTGASGEAPIAFTVTEGNLTQTFQIGGKEDGFDMDKFVFGMVGNPLTVADLDAVPEPSPPPEAGKILVPAFLTNGGLSISYGGTAGGQYAQEWTDSLNPPLTWIPMVTNVADSAGLVIFTSTPASSQRFCRIHDVSVPTPVANLTATAGNAQVSLGWDASSVATSYNVKSATMDGGPYATITNITTTGFVNTGLTNETTYYYVVSALNANGESADSSQASATPSTNISVRPLVYTVENTGADYPAPPLPTFANLPIVQPLTDPFMWSSTDPYHWTYPTGRSTNFADWSHRRTEIKAELENYEIGYKPPVDPSMIFVSITGSGTSRTLIVRTTNIVNGVARTLTQTAAISLPGSSGTFPVMIGMDSANGSISLGGRPIATITYNAISQITQHESFGTPSNSDPYYALYAPPYSPTINLDTTGQYSAWAWGCSRLIDALYKLNGNLGGGVQINLERIGVTGCSYAGKMALFCGALDERIALTIPQESGGGGAPNWRYSATEPTGTVEGLAQTSHNWFRNDMFQFGGANTAKLPEDHHELLAMVAPRALFATGNPDGATWLSNPSCYVSCKAVERVYDTFGISDRFGYNINGGKSHCARTTDLDNDVYAFLDKFLLGLTNVDTASVRHVPSSYSSIDYARWTAWWGTTDPTFAGGVAATYTNTYEPECATVGSAWNIVADAAASNGRYVTVTPGTQSLSSAPNTAADWVVIPVSVPAVGNASVFGRVNCPTADDDSFWVQMDGGTWTMLNGLGTSGWGWVNFGTFNLTAGAHTLTIGYREDGALLDKILVSDYQFSPSGMGPDAAILCP